jgi:streptomycin 3"-adenylyltransferase
MVSQYGRALVGPRPAELFEPVPHEDLVRAMLDSLDPLRGDLEGDTRNVVLTLARIWTSLGTGAIMPKHVAAEWVIRWLPEAERPVLERARAAYLAGEPGTWGDLEDRVTAFAEYAVARIHRLGSSRGTRGGAPSLDR